MAEGGSSVSNPANAMPVYNAGYGDIFPVAPSDTATYSPPIKAFSVTVAGNVAVRCAETGTVVTIPVIAGVQTFGRVDRIMLTNTTATGIVGFR